jgi:hypothetical protein
VVVVLPCVPATAIGRLEPHQLSQHLGAADDRDAPLIGAIDFRIAALDGRGGDHHGGIAQILRLVADRHRNALLAQPSMT